MYKVKANWLLDKVSPWSNENNYGQENDALEGFSLSKLKECLAQIKVTVKQNSQVTLQLEGNVLLDITIFC